MVVGGVLGSLQEQDVSQTPERPLRRSREALTELLDQLDGNEHAPNANSKRAHERFKYRARRLMLSLENAHGEPMNYAAASRNISNGGASLLIGQFVYPGSRCVVHLTSVHNVWQQVAGEIVRCRYIEGTANLHEVGVKFEKEIDVAMFHRDASRIRLLVVDDDPMLARLFRSILSHMNVDMVAVTEGADAIETIEEQKFDIVFMDIHLPDANGLDLVQQLRERGHFGAIVAVTAQASEGFRDECLAAGCNEYLAKPLNRENVVSMVNMMVDEPIISTLIHEPAMANLIDEFVGQLKKCLPNLERAFQEQNTDVLRRTAMLLKGQGGSYGFEIISEAAGKLESALDESQELSAIRTPLNELLRLCISAQPASCNVNAVDQHPDASRSADSDTIESVREFESGE